jgi:hypothetical protein
MPIVVLGRQVPSDARFRGGPAKGSEATVPIRFAGSLQSTARKLLPVSRLDASWLSVNKWRLTQAGIWGSE